MSDQYQAGVDGRERRAVELAIERETAVLLERLERRSEQLEAAELELLELRIDHEQTRAHVAELEHELGSATLEVARLQGELDTLRSTLGAVQQAHREVLSSRSWRITGPLRRARQTGPGPR